MTKISEHLNRLDLARNPFPPATTGVGFVEDISLPSRWEAALHAHIRELAESEGEKALVIEGAYGAGKTFILNWVHTKVLPQYRVQGYFFENPGVAFYDLANRLMRQVGRYEVAKALWELLSPSDPSAPRQLFAPEFRQWLATVENRKNRDTAIQLLSTGMKERKFADDEEILNKLSRMVVETGSRPYFEYRDFVPRGPQSLVAEKEEPQYFQALVRILQSISDADGIAFLLDEFEDVALKKQLSQSQASAYTSTLRRLLDAAQLENLWVVLSTTPEGLSVTSQLDVSLVDRFGHTFRIPELSLEEAFDIVAERLASVRPIDSTGLWPFADDVLEPLNETSRSSPRRLIKIMWHAIGLAIEGKIEPPLSTSLVKESEARLYADAN